MPICNETNENDRPSDHEIREALGRVLKSPRFRDSPQISSFLRYVVETTLAGKAELIKGYTIAVEALGRDESFDPNSQSIVRTEAARLRNELARYFEGIGRQDPLRILLPRGRYVPEFVYHQETAPEEPAPAAVPAPASLAAVPPGASPSAADPAAPMPGVLPPAPTTAEPQPASRPRARSGMLRGAVPALLGLVVALFGYAAFDAFVLESWLEPARGMRQADAAGLSRPVAPRHGEPRILVESVGTARTNVSAEFENRLIDVLSRFEEIVVVLPPPGGDDDPTTIAAIPTDYVLSIADARGSAGSRSPLRLRLTDARSRAVLWQREYVPAAAGDATPVRDQFILSAVTMLLQPSGIVPAIERGRVQAGEPRRPYHCALDAMQASRYFDRATRDSARECLEKAVADDPSFGFGYVALARMHLRGYIYAGKPAPDELDRALDYARRGVELGPTSARAHFTLMQVQVARGFVDDATMLGERALALNPFDIRVLTRYGSHLVGKGEIARGRAYLEQARQASAVLPLPLAWSLFLAAYLQDDLDTAALCADQMTDDFEYNLVSRALLAGARNQAETARRMIARLHAKNPDWAADPRGHLARIIPSEAILERLSKDLMRLNALASN
ncbi:hypothetical protein A33M_3849 [Rhodovulum sp. PH10]|uniref:tetratricopeptide repeat protein n=1 Tax=Rhodovulum sp. PH10 TaxID=1187851 RepID=UPI00027C271C|nr:hypothetical protein [Rhodovulum sp. PH10]EJW13429.1 hypothetical protein A33M_3849 [Rhodovulum sp. PH10]